MVPNPLTPVEQVKRCAAMMAIVGIRKDRTDLPETETYVRKLRDDNRQERFEAQWRRNEE